MAVPATKGDVFACDSVALPTKGDVLVCDSVALPTKGDVENVDCCVVEADMLPIHQKSSRSAPISHTSTSYVGEPLTEILQLEQLLVDSCPASCFSAWGLSDIPPLPMVTNVVDDMSNISNIVGVEVHVFPGAD